MFIDTTTIIETLRAHLAALTPAADSAPDERLFQRVGIFGAAQLAQALRATFATEQRVAFLVPGPEAHAGRRDRSMVYSMRTVRLAVLMADRSMDAARPDAIVGGQRNLGILAMKDRVINSLFGATPAFPDDLAYVPDTGEPLMISEADKPASNLGRECWLQWFSVYGGTGRQAVP